MKRKEEEKRKQEAAAKETLVVGVGVCFDWPRRRLEPGCALLSDSPKADYCADTRTCATSAERGLGACSQRPQLPQVLSMLI